MKRIVPLNLQYFAEEGQQTESGQAGTQNTSATPEIDYDKLAGIISGKQSVAEDTGKACRTGKASDNSGTGTWLRCQNRSVCH